MTDDTHTAGPRHSRVLAFLAGFVQAPLLIAATWIAISGIFVLPWAFALVTIMGIIAGVAQLYEAIIGDDTRAQRLHIHARTTGGISAVSITLLLVIMLPLSNSVRLPAWLVATSPERSWVSFLAGLLLIALFAVLNYGPVVMLLRRHREHEQEQP